MTSRGTKRRRGSEGRTIAIIAEGNTEKAAGSHLKRFLDERAGSRPRVRIQINTIDGALNEPQVRGRTEAFLEDPSMIGVIALTDLYPGFASVSGAKRIVRSWMPDDPRCHVHVAKHDFEAWLLVGWDSLLEQAGLKSGRKPWGRHPEDINHDHPPAHRVSSLFQEGKPPRKYKKPIDGKKLFERLDLLEVAGRCPEFKQFLNRLLTLAGYPPIP